LLFSVLPPLLGDVSFVYKCVAVMSECESAFIDRNLKTK